MGHAACSPPLGTNRTRRKGNPPRGVVPLYPGLALAAGLWERGRRTKRSPREPWTLLRGAVLWY